MSEKKMIKLFEQLRYRHDLFNVFSDFLEMSSIAISNSVDYFHRAKREKRYMDIVKKYSKEEVAIFPQLLGELVQSLDDDPADVLGNVYMQLELYNSWTGQFFTPMSICQLMDDLILPDRLDDIENQGYFTLNEPACGGGATVIGMAKALQKQEHNYQRCMRVVAQDIDIKSVHMCYLQLSLLGIDAIVMRGDTLAMKFDKGIWRTPGHMLRWTHMSKEQKKLEYEQLSLF